MMWEGERGSVLMVLVITAFVTGILIPLVGLMFQGAKRAEERLGSAVRALRCRDDVASIVESVAEGLGGVVANDPIFPWTEPCGGSDPGCVEGTLVVRKDGTVWNLRIVGTGVSRVHVWLWKDSIPLCRGDMVRGRP